MTLSQTTKTVIDMIKNLLLALLLISPTSFADWGDVYYCQMTTFSSTTIKGKRTDNTLEKFQFKLDKTKNSMVFGSSGYFKDSETKLIPKMHWPNIESWHGGGAYHQTYFDRGKCLYSQVGSIGITTVSANCDKF